MVEYFEIGQISNTHGLKGEVKVRAFTNNINDFENYKNVLIDFNGNLKEYEIENIRYQQDIVLVKFKDVDDIDVSEKLKGHLIKIPRASAKKIAKDEYFIVDLIGLNVYQNKELIGVLDDIFEAGASDVYVIKRKDKKDLLLPSISSVIKNIDIEKGEIEVEIPRGLEDEV